jgi:hypothetical protein
VPDDEYDPTAWPEDRSRPAEARGNHLIPAGPRWGMRTMGFLALMLVALVASSFAGGYSLLTLLALLVGLSGAIYCTARGLGQMQRRD